MPPRDHGSTRRAGHASRSRRQARPPGARRRIRGWSRASRGDSHPRHPESPQQAPIHQGGRRGPAHCRRALPSGSTTARIASRSAPPAKTLTRRKNACSGRPAGRSSNRWRRGGCVAGPAGRDETSPGAPGDGPAGRRSGPARGRCTRAAASSIASGRPSSRRQIDGDGGCVRVAQREVRTGGSGSLDEQLDRLVGLDVLGLGTPGSAGRPSGCTW